MTMRAFSPRSSMLRTLPSSSMIPVNILAIQIYTIILPHAKHLFDALSG